MSDGIPAVIVRGYDYNVSNTENIGNTIWRHGKPWETIKEILNVTAGTQDFKRRVLLKVISWFV